MNNIKTAQYCIGQRFLDVTDNQIYLLCAVDINTVCLIALSDGNRYVEPVHVEHAYKITEKEFELVAGGDHEKFIKIKE